VSEGNYLLRLKFIESALQLRHSSESSKLCVNVTTGSGRLSKYNEFSNAAAFAVCVATARCLSVTVY